MAYNLRNHERINYRAIENPTLLRDRATRTQGSQRLYELEIVEEDDYTGWVKVHYIGYNLEYDEWRNKEDVVVPSWFGRPVLCVDEMALGGGEL